MAGNFVHIAFAVEPIAQKTIKPASSVMQKLNVVSVKDEAAMLRAQNNHLRKQVVKLNQLITDFQDNKWFCAERGVSATKSGKMQDCSPYACGYISGQCLTYANNTTECSGNYNWVAGGRCE
jgi:hypothetical protein